MNWSAVICLLDIGSRVYVAIVLICLGTISWRVARNDGVLFRRLTVAWFCLAIPFTANAIGILENSLDLLPGLDLRVFIRQWMWVGHSIAGTAAWAFWDALNRQHPRETR